MVHALSRVGRYQPLFAATVLFAFSGHAQPSGAHIPAARGTSLTGEAIVLPDAFKGKLNVVIVGFSRASQGQVANWGRLVDAAYGEKKVLDYFEIPMLGGAPRMLRGMIVKNMGKSVPAAQKAHLVPVMDDDKPWRALAHYDKPDDAYLMIVDSDGSIRWQTHGDATDAAWSRFQREITGLLEPGSH